MLRSLPWLCKLLQDTLWSSESAQQMSAMATVPVSFGTQQAETSTFYGSFSDEARCVRKGTVVRTTGDSGPKACHSFLLVAASNSMDGPRHIDWLHVFVQVGSCAGEDHLPKPSQSWKLHATFATTSSTSCTLTPTQWRGIYNYLTQKWPFATIGTAERFLVVSWDIIGVMVTGVTRVQVGLRSLHRSGF